jgi:hypothetical protein
VKYFTLKRLSGTVDYDLHVNLSTVKVHLDSTGKLVCDNDAIVIGVTKREIGVNTGAADLIKTQIPNNLGIYYSVDNQVEEQKSIYQSGAHSYDYPHSCIWLKDVSGSKQNVPIDEKPQLVSIFLKDENGNILDREDIPVVYDGADGAPSYYLDLSNDYDQLYYNNNKIIPNQTDFESVITFYKGVDKQNLNASNSTVTITSPWNNKGEYSISYDAGSINLTIDWDKIDLSDLINNGKIPNQIEYKI